MSTNSEQLWNLGQLAARARAGTNERGPRGWSSRQGRSGEILSLGVRGHPLALSRRAPTHLVGRGQPWRHQRAIRFFFLPSI
jgi:hypothetical protein